MKHLVFLLLLSLSLVFTGCDVNDSLFPESELESDLKSAELKMVPIKGEIQSHVTAYQDGVPVQGILSGNMTHLGQLIAEKSIFNTTSLTLDEATWTISWEMSGVTCAANGDFMYYNLSGTFNIPANELIAHIEIENGTGRFQNAEGYIEARGYADDPKAITTMYMHCEGLISSVGSGKY